MFIISEKSSLYKYLEVNIFIHDYYRKLGGLKLLDLLENIVYNR